MSLFSFAQGHDSFFQVSGDNRLNLWDTASGELKLSKHEKNHLTANYTCSTFGVVGDVSVKSKKTKKRKSESGKVKKIVAVGTNKGRVTIWDFTSGDSIHENLEIPGASASDEITDVCLSKDCASLFVCSSKWKYVYELDVTKGEVTRKLKVGKQGAAKLCLSGDGKLLLTAGTSIKLWDLKTASKLKRFAGHSSLVKGLAFSPDSKYFISFSEERFLNLWSCATVSAKKKGKKDGDDEKKIPLQRNPCGVFSVPDTPLWAGLENGAGAKNSLSLVVSCEDQNAYLWLVDEESLNEDEDGEGAARNKGKSPDCKLINNREETTGEDGAVLAVVFTGTNGTDALVARKTPLRPHFESVQVFNTDGVVEDEVLLETLSEEGRLLKSAKENKAIADAAKENGDVAAASLPTKEGKEKLHIVKSAKGAAVAPSTLENMEEDDDDNRTMGDRAQALSDSVAPVLEENFELMDGDTISKGKKRGRDQQAAAGSLGTVLEQALQSNDNQLLEVVLRNADDKIVKATVKTLPPARVLQFLSSVVAKFESRPARGPILLVWIRAVLEQHASYLVNSPDLAESLGGLYQIIESRLTVFNKFTKLCGRLEFVVNQIAQETTNQKTTTPTIVYDEEAPANDSDDEEESGDDEEESGDEEEPVMEEVDEDSESEEEKPKAATRSSKRRRKSTK